MAKVNTYVYVMKDGYPVLLTPGDDVPDGVEITNPAVLDESEADAVEGNQEVDPEADEPETPAESEPAPAPQKRTSRKADTASE